MKSKKTALIFAISLLAFTTHQTVKPIGAVGIAFCIIGPWVLGTITALTMITVTGFKAAKYAGKACLSASKECYKQVIKQTTAQDCVKYADKITAYSATITIHGRHKAGRRSTPEAELTVSSASLPALIDQVATFIEKHDDNAKISIQPQITVISGKHYTVSTCNNYVKNAEDIKETLFDLLYVPRKQEQIKRQDLIITDHSEHDSMTGPHYSARTPDALIFPHSAN